RQVAGPRRCTDIHPVTFGTIGGGPGNGRIQGHVGRPVHWGGDGGTFRDGQRCFGSEADFRTSGCLPGGVVGDDPQIVSCVLLKSSFRDEGSSGDLHAIRQV